jgi:hypothetical protein
MVSAVSMIGGLLLMGYCVSRVKASREAKKSVQLNGVKLMRAISPSTASGPTAAR